MDRISRSSFLPARMPSGAEAAFPEGPIADIPSGMAQTQDNPLQNEYPDIYFDLYPLIAEASEKMLSGGYPITAGMINSMVDTILKNSGMWFEDDDAGLEEIPAQFGFGAAPFRKRRRGSHNRNTLRDIIRILLLRDLLGGRRPGRF